MKTTKGFRVMLAPNNAQTSRLFQFAGCARVAYNWALDMEMQAFKRGEKFINEFELRKMFTQHKRDGGQTWLNEVSNNALKQAIKDLIKAYQRFFKIQRDRKAQGKGAYSKKKLKHLARIGKQPTTYDLYGHPKFKSRKNGDVRFFQDNVKIRFTATHVRIEKIAPDTKRKHEHLNWVRLAERGRIPSGKYVNPRVTFDGEHWWVSVGVETEVADPTGVYGEVVGVDLGLKDLAICSDGNKVVNVNKSNTVRKLEKKQRRLQRRVSRKYKMNREGERYRKTANVAKLEKRVLRVQHRLTNIRTDHVHQATTALVARKPSAICLEDLNVQGMMANKHLAKSIQAQKWREFRQQVEYKAKLAGVTVVIADRFYPSSKTCGKCGHVKKDLKLWERTYVCPECGNVIDRDLQAALNLKPSTWVNGRKA